MLGVLCVAAWWVLWAWGSADSPAAPPAEAGAVPQPSPWSTALVAVRAAGQSIDRAVAAVPRGADEVQGCGGEWSKLKAEDASGVEVPPPSARFEERRATVLAALRASPDELARVAARWLDVATAGALAAHAREESACETDACRAALPLWPALQRMREALATAAVSSHNAEVYALAFHTCGQLGGGSEGTCQLINARQWARLAPDNAQPWLFMLSDAVQREDVAAQDEALHRIGSARRSDMGFATIPGLVIRNAPDDDAYVPAVLSLVVEATGRSAAWRIPGYQSLLNSCKRDALRDANRQRACEAAAELLTERSDTRIERSIGTSLGKQVGWPVERSDRLRGEDSAFVDAESARLAAVTSAAGNRKCAVLRSMLAQVARNAELGETGYLREWVAKSGKTPEEFVRIERARREPAASEAASTSVAR